MIVNGSKTPCGVIHLLAGAYTLSFIPVSAGTSKNINPGTQGCYKGFLPTYCQAIPEDMHAAPPDGFLHLRYGRRWNAPDADAGKRDLRG